MKLRIQELYSITRDHQHIEATIALQELTETSHIADISDVFISVDVETPKPNHYRVVGVVQTDVGMICSNCLQDLRVKVNVKLNEMFVLTEPDDSDMYEESKEDYNYIVGQEIDLIPYVKQEILLSLPMRPLCQDACKGLCPKCGTNKNQNQCDCNTERIDPRLADLADFFKK